MILEKIKNNNEIIGVIGLGYVGLPLAMSFSKAHSKVIGFDISTKVVDTINEGLSLIDDVSNKELRQYLKKGCFKATYDFKNLAICDAIFICVPTPLDEFLKPDMSFVEDACRTISKHMSKNTFICLESTTYPTTTEDLILPLIESGNKFKHGSDFWLAYSPERVDPGNQKFNTTNTPKVIGALDETGLKIGLKIYSKAIKTIHTVSSPRVAEMVKILENTYRLVNISLINELALLCGKMEIDIWEVIEGARSKPFGFQAFYPGPGIGGHCIPLDPFYLEHIAKKYEFDLSLIHTAGHINMRMPHYMYIKITTALNYNDKAVFKSKILFVGVTYKKNINDIRESPILKIMTKCKQKGGIISYHDPFVHEISLEKGDNFKSIELTSKNIKDHDLIVIGTDHDQIDYKLISESSKIIVDFKNKIDKANHVYKL